MSAAAARPPLFSHLVASRPDRDRGSIGATVASVALHGALTAAAVTLSTQVRTPPTVVDERPVILVFPPAPAPEVIRAQNSGGRGTVAGPAGPIVPEFSLPDIDISNTIPKPGVEVVPFPDRFPAVPGKVIPDGQPGSGTGDAGAPGTFVVVTKMPRLLNRPEIERHMIRFYPNNLLQAGIGGTPIIWLRLDEEGLVTETQLKVSSGQRALDEAALEVGKRARFSPAYNGDSRVRVWVELPIVFQARN